jgi:hypothetical protein
MPFIPMRVDAYPLRVGRADSIALVNAEKD